MAKSTTTAGARDSETRLTITRRIAASPNDVFDAWTDPNSMRTWMRPGDGVDSRVTLDVRVGGKYRIDMIRGNGRVYEHTGEYLVVDRPHTLKFTWISEGTEQRTSTVTIELRPVGKETELTLTHEGLPTAKATAGHTQGWTEIIEQFEKAQKH
jgi:uncharacterized protein YndB with AHSA1/START domain